MVGSAQFLHTQIQGMYSTVHHFNHGLP